MLLLLLNRFSSVQPCTTPLMAVHQAPCPWNSQGKNTGGGCHFLHQCMKVKSESEVTQWCPTLSDPMDCSLSGSSFHGISQARVLEWGAIAFSYICHEIATLQSDLLTLVFSSFPQHINYFLHWSLEFLKVIHEGWYQFLNSWSIDSLTNSHETNIPQGICNVNPFQRFSFVCPDPSEGLISMAAIDLCNVFLK